MLIGCCKEESKPDIRDNYIGNYKCSLLEILYMHDGPGSFIVDTLKNVSDTIFEITKSDHYNEILFLSQSWSFDHENDGFWINEGCIDTSCMDFRSYYLFLNTDSIAFFGHVGSGSYTEYHIKGLKLKN